MPPFSFFAIARTLSIHGSAERNQFCFFGTNSLALAQDADAHAVGVLLAFARRGRIDRRAAFRAERLDARRAAVGRQLEVVLRRARHLERRCRAPAPRRGTPSRCRSGNRCNGRSRPSPGSASPSMVMVPQAQLPSILMLASLSFISLFHAGFDRRHVLVRQAEMVADLVHQHMGDDRRRASRRARPSRAASARGRARPCSASGRDMLSDWNGRPTPWNRPMRSSSLSMPIASSTSSVAYSVTRITRSLHSARNCSGNCAIGFVRHPLELVERRRLGVEPAIGSARTRS